jgi:hypothetical protein
MGKKKKNTSKTTVVEATPPEKPIMLISVYLIFAAIAIAVMIQMAVSLPEPDELEAVTGSLDSISCPSNEHQKARMSVVMLGDDNRTYKMTTQNKVTCFLFQKQMTAGQSVRVLLDSKNKQLWELFIGETRIVTYKDVKNEKRLFVIAIGIVTFLIGFFVFFKTKRKVMEVS